jgi:ubiquinone/menaquinone biosynthesis C-methylase UbiE
MPVSLTTGEYIRFTRRYGTLNWLQAGPDYSRAVEYPVVARMLDLSPGDRLLDVGSGRRGEFASLLARSGVAVTAIDPRPDAGEEALESGVDFRQADATALDFPDGSFDRVSAISTLEHIEGAEPQAAAELARVLAPGGRMVVSVPYNPLKSATVYMRDGVYGRTGDRVYFQRIYDDDALQERIIAPTGLEVVERVVLGEPGVRLSRAYYDPRSRVWRALRFRLPVGPVLAAAAPRFLRQVDPATLGPEDWTGVAVVLAFRK